MVVRQEREEGACFQGLPGAPGTGAVIDDYATVHTVSPHPVHLHPNCPPVGEVFHETSRESGCPSAERRERGRQRHGGQIGVVAGGKNGGRCSSPAMEKVSLSTVIIFRYSFSSQFIVYAKSFSFSMRKEK